MSRGLTTAVKNELATGNINPVHLIHLNFATPLYLTDCSFPLTSSISGSSVTYTSSDFIIGVSDFTEEIDVTKSSLTISFEIDINFDNIDKLGNNVRNNICSYAS